MSDVTLETGVRLHVDERGPDAAPIVLLLNGLTMRLEAWDPVVAGLERDHRVIRYDMRGQGGSESPSGPHTPEVHAADLVALVQALAARGSGLRGAAGDALPHPPLRLVGLSNGGLVAMLAAARLERRAPVRVESLAVIASFGRVDEHLRLVLASWRAALDAGGSALRFDVAAPWVWGHRYVERHGDTLAAARALAAQAPEPNVRSLVDGLASFEGDAWTALSAFDRPVLALFGRDDVLTPVRHGAEIVDHARDGSLVLLDDAGHGAPIERPDAVEAALRAFWTSTAARAPHGRGGA